MSDPFLLPPRSVVSFSGGRTSGYMLWRVLQAFGGTLPDDRRVIFCNTGKEREETLEFVERCSQRWGVPVTWLEYRWEPGRKYFVEVDFASASRDGEPFKLLIQSRKMLPNKTMRFCTIDLKLRPSNRYVRQILGWKEYMNAIGFRHDEPKRIAKLEGEKKSSQVYAKLFEEFDQDEPEERDYLPGETPFCPLDVAKITKPMILDWWARNDFDLRLEEGEGNCDLCFLKGGAILVKLMEKRPADAAWWIERERERERELSERAMTLRKRRFALFDARRPSYEGLLAIAQGKDDGPGWLWADGKQNRSCGEMAECRCTD